MTETARGGPGIHERPVAVKVIKAKVPPERRAQVIARDASLCRYCGRPVEAPTIDHVVPRSRGGRNSLVNLVVACKQCGSRKGDRTPEEAGMPLLAVGTLIDPEPRREGAKSRKRRLAEHYRWSGKPRIGYPSRGIAELVAHAAWEANPAGRTGPNEAALCKVCDEWHLRRRPTPNLRRTHYRMSHHLCEQNARVLGCLKAENDQAPRARIAAIEGRFRAVRKRLEASYPALAETMKAGRAV